MLSHAGYTAVWIICMLLALVAIGSLFQFLRKITDKEAKEKEWYRYVGPTLAAMILSAFFHDVGMGSIGQWFYMLLVSIGVPVALAYFLLKDQFEGRNERIMVVAALVMFFNAAVYTSLWSQHYRLNHAVSGGDNNDEENPHLGKRNAFLIPFWVLTVLVGIASGHMFRRNQKETIQEDSAYLPF